MAHLYTGLNGIVPPEEDPEENSDEVVNPFEEGPADEMTDLGMTPKQYEEYKKQQTIKYLEVLAQFMDNYDDSTYTDQNGLNRVNPESDRWSRYDNPMQTMIDKDDVLSGRYFENGRPRLSQGPIQAPDQYEARKDLFKYLIDEYDRQKWEDVKPQLGIKQWEDQPRRKKNIEQGGNGVQLGEAAPYKPYYLDGSLWAGAAHPGNINPNFDSDAATEYIQDSNGVFSKNYDNGSRYSDEYEQFNQNQVNKWRQGY